VRLDELCLHFGDGDWIESKDQSNSGIRLVQTGNVGVAEYLNKPNNKKWIAEETFNKLKCEEVLPGDILISRLPEPAGRACIMPFLGVKMITAVDCTIARTAPDCSNKFLLQYLSTQGYFNEINSALAGGTRQRISRSNLANFYIPTAATYEEQEAIGEYFEKLDNLITLHQCESERIIMNYDLDDANRGELFYIYYQRWITLFKEGAIRDVTMAKYLMTLKWLKQLVPELRIGDLDRISYQQLLNDYAEEHERQTTMDFHHQLKGAILDALDDGYIDRDPTRKAIIKGKPPREKKKKYLNQFELQKLLSVLNLEDKVNWDWFILLIAKTGLRFSEALAVTPRDFDFTHQKLEVSKTWDYKMKGGYLPTKNKSSVRRIQIDWQTVIQFFELVKKLPDNEPIFAQKNTYNSTVNNILERKCDLAGIPHISIHGLRHTHASLLLFAGVSIASVARRLGHSSITTTQKTYIHIIKELENQDVDLVMRSLSGLN